MRINVKLKIKTSGYYCNENQRGKWGFFSYLSIYERT